MWGKARILLAVVLATLLFSGGTPPQTAASTSRAVPSDTRGAYSVNPPYGPGTVGLVVKPGNQVIPDLEGRFLAWQDESGAVPQVYVLDLATMVEVRAWPSPVAQFYPRLREGLLSFVEKQTVDYSGCPDWCTLLVWPASGATWRLWADSLHMAVTTDEYVVQTGGIVMPGGTGRIYARLLSNGSKALELRGGEPLENWLSSSEDWVALTLRPYSDGRGSYYCPSSGMNGLDPCVTEMGVVFPKNQTMLIVTDSLSQFRGTEIGDAWNWQCVKDFTREEFPSAFGSTVFRQDNRNSDFTFDPIRCTWSGEQWDIYAFDVGSGIEVAVRTAPWNETRPDVDENILVWADDRSGDWDIYAQFLDTGKEVRLTDDPATQRNPTVSNGCVAWEDNRNGDWDIYGRCLMESSLSGGGRNLVRRDLQEERDNVTWRGNRTATRDSRVPFEARVGGLATRLGQAGTGLEAASIEKNRTASRARSSVAS